MTCGIYCYIDSTNNSIVYIGQSVNMERRHTEHLSLANNPIFNYTSGGDGLGTKLGGFLDFITCELLHDLIDKEVNDVSS